MCPFARQSRRELEFGTPTAWLVFISMGLELAFFAAPLEQNLPHFAVFGTASSSSRVVCWGADVICVTVAADEVKKEFFIFDGLSNL